MSLQPRMILNGHDDVARRKARKQALADQVELGLLRRLWNSATGKKGTITNPGKKEEEKPGSQPQRSASSSDFDEKAHPRGPDGRFTDAPAGGGSGGLLHPEILRGEQEAQGRKDEIFLLKVEDWVSEKARWDKSENALVAKKVGAIKTKELGPAEKELRAARIAAARPDQSDDDAAKNAKRFVDANQKVKGIWKKINKIKPAPYKVPKPKKDDSVS